MTTPGTRLKRSESREGEEKKEGVHAAGELATDIQSLLSDVWFDLTYLV